MTLCRLAPQNAHGDLRIWDQQAARTTAPTAPQICVNLTEKVPLGPGMTYRLSMAWGR